MCPLFDVAIALFVVTTSTKAWPLSPSQSFRMAKWQTTFRTWRGVVVDLNSIVGKVNFEAAVTFAGQAEQVIYQS